MPSRIDVVLRKLGEQLAAVEASYRRDFAAEQLSEDLIYDIARLIEDCHRALDWTATDLDHAFGKGADRSPYFPLQKGAAKFAAVVQRDFPNLPTNVRDALERYQPYQPGKAALGYLHDLTRVSKHQDFAKKTRTETRRREVRTAGGSVSWDPSAVTFGSGVFIGGAPVDPRTQMPTGVPTTETIFVGWRFQKPAVEVMTTLRDLVQLVSDAVRDIRDEAGL